MSFDFFAPLTSDKTQKKQVNTGDDEKYNLHPKNVAVKKSLETQEEIDAWIAERRAKFPTRERIAEKNKEKAQREFSGKLDLSEGLGKKRDETEFGTQQPVSLVDILVEDAVREQRSIVLQCFRYFTQHNFLQSPE